MGIITCWILASLLLRAVSALDHCIASSSMITPTYTSSRVAPKSSSQPQLSVVTTFRGTSTTHTAISAPTPTKGVTLGFRFTIASDVEFVVAGANWVVFEEQAESDVAKRCEEEPVYYTLANGNIGLANVPLPPDLIMGNISGFTDCQYSKSSSGPGRFRCFEVPELQCEIDERDRQSCTENNPWLDITLVPRVVCWVP